jgi:hypothetical protein
MVQIETVNFRKFKTYADDRERKERKALSVIEENGIAAALERCRALTDRINTELDGKKPGHLNIASLAEFQVALERAASVLNEQLGDAAANLFRLLRPHASSMQQPSRTMPHGLHR